MTILVHCPANNCGDPLEVQVWGDVVCVTSQRCDCDLCPEELEHIREEARRTLVRAAP